MWLRQRRFTALHVLRGCRSTSSTSRRFCQFQFGSIVNRSPIVIGISTDGAAPILAQEIRRRIEAILPSNLAAWGDIARSVRSSVLAVLAKGPPRRRFWEAFAARAFARPPLADERQDLSRLLNAISLDHEQKTGHVTLVGAGPGDAELLTLKAVRAMQAADVILYDDLVSNDVLELGRREARRIMVGKRGQRDSCAQDDINATDDRPRAGGQAYRALEVRRPHDFRPCRGRDRSASRCRDHGGRRPRHQCRDGRRVSPGHFAHASGPRAVTALHHRSRSHRRTAI